MYDASTSRVLGYTPVEFVGRTIADVVHPDEWSGTQARLSELLVRPGHEITLETRVRHKDGSWCWVDGIARNALADPAIEAIVVNYRDTKERRHLEEQLLQAQKMEAVGRLAGGVAHDFNNLLTVITGYTSFALDEAEKGSELYAGLEEIHKAGVRASASQSSCSRSAGPRFLSRKCSTSTRSSPRWSGSYAGLSAKTLILSQSSTPLWSQFGPTRGQLEQAIMNLVVNSRHAMPNGGRLTIETANVDLDGAILAAAIPRRDPAGT